MPTDWNEQYAIGETPWDKGEPSPPLLEALGRLEISGRILVPGCGTGHDVRALAGQGAHVVGLDIAALAIERARTIAPVAGEEYVCGDLFDLPASLRGTFDAVFEHTCFCAIDPAMRPAYVAAVHGALRPGGLLYAVFYLDPGNASPDEGPPFETSVAELDRLFLPTFDLVEEWLPTAAYPGREGREWFRVMRSRDA